MNLRAPLLAALLLALPAARAAELPPATAAQLEKALERTDVARMGRPMKARTTAVVSRPNGSDREEEVVEMVGRGDGTVTTTVVKATKGGKDVTAEERAKQEKKDAAGAKPERKEKAGLGLRIPTGEDRKLFTLGEPKAEGNLLVVGYEPARGAKGDDLSRGRLAWNAATGEPAYVEAQMVDPPTGLKELKLRAEFQGAGDAIYTRLLRTSGVGGLLWIKRKFDVTVEMEPLP